MRILSFSFLLLLALGTTAPAVQFSIPDANQSVSQGSTIGFSFTLTSEEMLDLHGDPLTPWLLLNYATWVPDTGVAYPGVFLGFLGLNNEVVGPDTGGGEVNPFSQTYNGALGTGVGEMVVEAGATPGTYLGRIVVSYDMFSLSPRNGNFDNSLDYIETGTVSYPVAIRVTAADTGADVPEPGLTLLTGGWLALGFWIRRRK